MIEVRITYKGKLVSRLHAAHKLLAQELEKELPKIHRRIMAERMKAYAELIYGKRQSRKTQKRGKRGRND